jgi:hypothetical protein
MSKDDKNKSENSESDVFHCFEEVKSDNWKKWEASHSDKYKKVQRGVGKIS